MTWLRAGLGSMFSSAGQVMIPLIGEDLTKTVMGTA